MKIAQWSTVLALALGAGQASAQDYIPAEAAEARVWLDRGDEPLLQRGERVRVYYRTSEDAYVAIFQIDTDGSVRLLHPRAPGDETFTRGGRDYRLLFPQSSYWYVDEYPGKGYYFIVASPLPLDLSGLDYVRHERGWDLTRVGRTVYQDPYLAMDEYVARLIPDWETTPYALDFVSYDVGEIHEYPRFLCYDCHGFRSYSTWNPYTYACSSFRVVVWDDPYFYPAYRYQGTRVVFAQPRRGVAMFGFKDRAAGESWAPLIQTRQPPLRRSVEYVEPSAARSPLTERAIPRRPSGAAVPQGATPQRPATAPSAGAQPRATAPSRPSAQARPSAPPASDDRPVLQRRPPGSTATPPSSGTRPAVVRPPTATRPPTSGGASPSASRPSSAGGGARVVRPPASGGAASRPAVRPPSSSAGASRPTAAPSRPSASPSRPPPAAAKKPPPRRKPGGGE